MSTTDIRAAFEAWAEREGCDTANTHDGVRVIWLSPMTADLWAAWQAATEAAKATSVAVRELPEPPKPLYMNVQSLGAFAFKMDSAFTSDQIRAYGQQCAEAARQPAPASQIEHERNMLAKGIADAALKAGIWNGEVNLTGPHLLMFCDDLAGAALAATAAPVLSDEQIDQTLAKILAAFGSKLEWYGPRELAEMREAIADTRSQP